MDEHFWHRILPHWEKPGAAYFLTFRLVDSLPKPLVNRLKVERHQMLAATPGPNETEYQQKVRVKKAIFSRWDKYLDRANAERWLSDPAVAKLVRDALYYHAGGMYDLFAYVIMPNHVHALLKPRENTEEQTTHPVGARASSPAELSTGRSVEQSVAPAGQRSAVCLEQPARPPADARAPNGATPDHEALEFPETPTFESATSADPVLPKTMHSLKSYTANQANHTLGRSGSFWQAGYFDHWPRDLNELGRIMEYIEYNPVGPDWPRHPKGGPGRPQVIELSAAWRLGMPCSHECRGSRQTGARASIPAQRSTGQIVEQSVAFAGQDARAPACGGARPGARASSPAPRSTGQIVEQSGAFAGQDARAPA